ncbi:MAG: amidohydrolase family protein [Thermoanaerobaculia bacterium]|nr:amidohydrolase family protein [Thermoanaerobaculia bacterium]
MLRPLSSARPTALIALILLPILATAQIEEIPEGVEVPPFYDYDPPSTLVVPETEVTRAKYPFVDVHNHQFRMGGEQDLSELVVEMDRLNMAVMVNLSGRGFRRVEREDGSVGWELNTHEYLANAVARAEEQYPGRFVVFTNFSTEGIDEAGWAEETVAGLELDVANGARGLKVYKSLGMDAVDSRGERIPVDDPRLEPVWEACGRLGIPVLIHTGDPAQFWQPRDEMNERLYELIERPGRYRDPAENASWEQIMSEQHHLFRKHPETTFVNAHLGWLGNDLGRLGALLDEAPNVYTEIGAVLAELGRQPRFARDWLTRYQDRVMFGKDSWRPEEYHTYFRVLETDDDYFPYYRRRHAFWRIYGLDLPEEVLRKLYYENALRVIPGIDRTLFPN